MEQISENQPHNNELVPISIGRCSHRVVTGLGRAECWEAAQWLVGAIGVCDEHLTSALVGSSQSIVARITGAREKAESKPATQALDEANIPVAVDTLGRYIAPLAKRIGILADQRDSSEAMLAWLETPNVATAVVKVVAESGGTLTFFDAMRWLHNVTLSGDRRLADKRSHHPTGRAIEWVIRNPIVKMDSLPAQVRKVLTQPTKRTILTNYGIGGRDAREVTVSVPARIRIGCSALLGPCSCGDVHPDISTWYWEMSFDEIMAIAELAGSDCDPVVALRKDRPELGDYARGKLNQIADDLEKMIGGENKL